MVDSTPFSYDPRARGNAVNVSIERQMGEIVATVRAFQEDLSELKSYVQQLDRTQRESARDRRSQQQVVMARLEALERTTSTQHETNTGKLEQLTKEVAALKDPVDDFVTLRKRIGTITAAVLSIAGVAWMLGQPIYNLLINRIFSGH